MKKIIFLLLLFPLVVHTQNVEDKPANLATRADLALVNIRDFGAKTSAADNATAINAAATAAIGKVLYVPRGSFLTGGITLPDHTHLFFADSASELKLKTSPGSFISLITAGNDCTIEGGRLDGNTANSAVPGSSCIMWSGKTNLTVRGTTLSHAASHGIAMMNSSGFKLYNVEVDSTFDGYGLYIYNTGIGVVQDSYIKNWNRNQSAKTGIAVTQDVPNKCRDIIFRNVRTENVDNSNFSFESPGIGYQCKYITIENCVMIQHSTVHGGVGISMGLDSSTVQNNRIDTDSVTYGFETSGSAIHFTKNKFKNALVKTGTHVEDSARNNFYIENEFLITDKKPFDNIFAIGGGGPGAAQVYYGNVVKDNIFWCIGGRPGAFIVAGYYAGSRGRLVRNVFANNAFYSDTTNALGIYFSGTGGSQNTVKDNFYFAPPGGTFLFRDNGSYTATTFKGNQAYGATMFGGGVNNTNFPGYIDLFNVADTTSKLLTVPRLSGVGIAPTIAAGGGAGGSPTISLTGTDLAGVINLTTGTSPNTLAGIFTVTYNTAYSTKPYVVLTPANSATAALAAGVAYISDGSSGTSSFIVNSGAVALAATTSYQWYYHVIQ